MASYTEGLTLEDYISVAYENALDQELRASSYPAQSLRLDDAEIALVASLRQCSVADVNPNLLSQQEAAQILSYRAERNTLYVQIRSEYDACAKFVTECKAQPYVLPWFRHVILFRAPTDEEWLDHKIDLETIEEEAKKLAPRETATRRINRRRSFAYKCVLWPSVLPTENLSLLDSVYGYAISIAIDGERVDALKIIGP